MSIALEALREDGYRLGDLQVLRYDKNNRDIFPDDFLGQLYWRCRESKRRSGDGILTATFGGNPSSDFGSIVSYLHNRPALILMGVWEGDKFRYLGFAFPTVSCGWSGTEKSLIAGYAFFRDAWGTQEQEVLTMLGLAYLFNEFQLVAIHGNRFKDNVLTAKFMAKFGFRDVGEVPRFQVSGKELVPMVLSTLLREDFEAYVEGWLVSQLHTEVAPVIGTPEHPAVEESRETIDAQIARLAARQIPVVFFPLNSTYVPALPDGIEIQFVSSGNPGAGIYFFDPRQTSAEQITSAANEGTHGALLGHAQNKMDIARTEPTVVVQAIDTDGVVLQDSVVSKTAEAIAVQIAIFERKYPDCRCEIRDPMDVVRERVAETEPVSEPIAVADDEYQLDLNWM